MSVTPLSTPLNMIHCVDGSSQWVLRVNKCSFAVLTPSKVGSLDISGRRFPWVLFSFYPQSENPYKRPLQGSNALTIGLCIF